MEKLPSDKIENQSEQDFLIRERALQERLKDKPKAASLARIFSALTAASLEQRESVSGNLN